ncbi:AI-2E family transporter [Noviherbaspirillum sp. UKPF54]|uniref:AI-2E family transporter n=1 Tax=Noviherbaspirillum sp. UKPF54 TaxID=2601898 RepID=UPI0011B1A299|nr:AI-2E family transporter [Noviherbaspirillum sp. UKPF54]QDZ27071.1 AI-2E family transporter [Noviherbaspirillum sp. UKPF54]
MAAGIDPRPGEFGQGEPLAAQGPSAEGRAPRRPVPARSTFSPRRAPEPLMFSDTQFFRRTVFVSGMTIATALVLALIWNASEVFLVLFASILLAVLVRAPINGIVRHLRLTPNMALGLSVLALVSVLGTLVYIFAVPMAEQVGQLMSQLPRAMARLRQSLREYQWARPLLLEMSHAQLDLRTLVQARGLISSTASALIGLLIVFFIGVYLAAQPRLYQRGFMNLLPKHMRPRTAEVLDEIGSVLRWWLLGRLIVMLLVGFAAGIGLWWLDIPLAATLGVLSGMLEFIPYLGPILSAISPLLIAFNVGPTQAFYVLMLYVAIQTAEGYLISPLIEQRTVSLPPALVIFATVLLAALAGPLGAVLASPLTAAGIVAVRLLYVEDVVEQVEKLNAGGEAGRAGRPG